MSKRINLFLRFVVTILSIHTLTGCGHYLYTVSEISPGSKLPDQFQIVKSNLYKQISKNTHTVSIKAPDACYGQTSTSSDQSIKYQKDVVRSNCGVEIGIIEKKLIENDYEVVSWEILKSMAESSDKSSNISYQQAAKELGVDVLFSINLLEKVGANDLHNLINRSYFYSDKTGKKGDPWILGEGHRKKIREILHGHELDFYGVSFGSSIDVTAIDVKSGKSIWFYKASFYNLKKRENKITAVFAGKKNIWRILKLNGVPVRTIRRRSRSNTEFDRKEKTNENIYYQKYLTRAVSAFISSFKHGK